MEYRHYVVAQQPVEIRFVECCKIGRNDKGFPSKEVTQKNMNNTVFTLFEKFLFHIYGNF